MTLPDNMIDDMDEPPEEIFLWELEAVGGNRILQIGEAPSRGHDSGVVEEVRIVSVNVVPEDDR